MSDAVLLKDTVLLPKTSFPMKADLPTREPQIIATWEKMNLHQKILDKNKGRPTFTMPDGPPYANGNLHIGHVLNKCLKDITVKFRNLGGWRAAFIPGWDCHGLPIEHKVTKDLGAKRRDMSDSDVRRLCREEAGKWVAAQRDQFRRLGILADWDHLYRTMDPSYEAQEIRELARTLERGYMVRGEKPVYWCPALQTALAEAEVEYHPHKSPSIYLSFSLAAADLARAREWLKGQGVNLTDGAGGEWGFAVWTTTPWTLPANQAVALHREHAYRFFQTERGILILGDSLRESAGQALGLELKPLGPAVRGDFFTGWSATHPFYDRPSPVVFGDHVTMEATGVVHTAPGHGQDDYRLGLEFGLKIFSPIDAAGRFTKEVPEYEGTKIWDANSLIIERLREANRLLAFTTIEHQYPHNWRSKTPLIFRATPQWFLLMDTPPQVAGKNAGETLRCLARQALDETVFTPKWGEARLRAMIENRPDWCLSRQRVWGVPIPVFECTSCHHIIADPNVMRRVADAVEKEGGIDAYHQHAPADFLRAPGSTEIPKCKECGGTDFKRGGDILDVWFDSGMSWAAVSKKRAELYYPADVYLEGSDQHRGWFQTSLLASLAAEGRAPFRHLVTHGFVNDMQGRKMSKSLGNVVEPAEISEKFGAEILRLWVAFEDYGDDLSCGKISFERTVEVYRRFRNTARFLVGNLFDFDPARDSVPFTQLRSVDQWVLGALAQLVNESRGHYENYEYHRVAHAANHFITVELSAGYLDLVKDRLYTQRADGRLRRSAQTVIYQIATSLSRLLAPLTSFLSEEIHSHLPGKREESVFLTDYPAPPSEWTLAPLKAGLFQKLSEIKAAAGKSMELLRREKTIGASVDAELEIHAPAEMITALQSMTIEELKEFFIVSKISWRESSELDVKARHAPGEKCERCWTWSEQRGKNSAYPTLCVRCTEVLTGGEQQWHA